MYRDMGKRKAYLVIDFTEYFQQLKYINENEKTEFDLDLWLSYNNSEPQKVIKNCHPLAYINLTMCELGEDLTKVWVYDL